MKQNGNSNFFQVEYIKFIPGGNDTALVLTKNYTTEEKKAINDVILDYDKSIEQVGFVDAEQLPELQMAGGEFCGNATRSAAYYYLKGKAGTIKVLVNGNDEISAGVYESGEAWCEIPLYHGNDVIIEKERGIYQVRMNGMVSIVIREDIAKQYLQEKDKLKEFAVQFIEKYELYENEAVGVMFLERTDKLKIHPVVWVRSINTLYYETGCGSGTTATAMVEAFLKNKNQKLEIVQPSGLAITAEITIENKHVIKAVISGKVNTDNKVVKVNILKVETEEKAMKGKIREIKKEDYTDFYKMYKVFENPPYSEKFSDEEIHSEYELLTSGGHVYGYYEKDVCVGMVTYNNKQFYHHPVHYEYSSKVAYLSDVTVLEKHRGQGIGTMLMRFALIEAKKEGYEIIYMRTLQPGQSMSYGIALSQLGIEDETFKTGVQELTDVVKYIRALGVSDDYFAVDLKIARGLDYYTGTVYETFLNDYRKIGSVCSGGRFDNLAEYYTDKKLPGVGISIGLTRLFYQLNQMEVIKVKKASIADVLIIPMETEIEECLEVASKLRSANINTDLYLDTGKMKKKMKYADKWNIPYVIIIGQEERDSGFLTLKNMETGEQKKLVVEDIIKEILK